MNLNFKFLSEIPIFFSDWYELLRSIITRFIEGFKYVDFILYFLVVIILVGGLGVFPSAYQYFIVPSADKAIHQSEGIDFAKSLSTYFITIIATSSADLILNKEPDENEAHMFRMPAVTCLILGAIFIFLIQINLFKDYTIQIGYIATALALFLWWITNSKDKKYVKPQSGKTNFSPLGVEIPEVDETNPDQQRKTPGRGRPTVKM